MKILLIIPLMSYNAGTNPNKTYHINKEVYNTLNHSIPMLKNIANESKRILSNKSNEVLYLCMVDFKNIKTSIGLTGEISKNHLNLNFVSIENLDQLNNLNKELLPLENIRHHFLNIVISLIKNIFQSIPEEDVEISNKSSNFLMNWFKKNNQNQITISVTHKYSTKITFNCYLAEDSNNVAKTSKPNEAGEEESPLLDKKRK